MRRILLAFALAAGMTRHVVARDVASADAGAPEDSASASPDNPLRSVTISTLSATRERPLFSPSRRPPPTMGPPPVAAPPPPPVQAQTQAEEAPPFLLLGSVKTPDASLAVLQNLSSGEIVRMREGQSKEGWLAQRVDRREVVLQKDGAVVTLEFPQPEAAPPVEPEASASNPPPAPPPPAPPPLQPRVGSNRAPKQ